MHSKLMSLDQAAALLKGSANYLVAADEKALRKLPKGNWIGGSIPYFMGQDGGVVSQEQVFVTELPKTIRLASIEFMDETTISEVYSRIPGNGFGVMILPASTPIHFSFAVESPNYDNFAVRPLVGWISGVHLSELGKSKPLTVNGKTGEVSDSKAIVLYADLPAEYGCDVGIINIFSQGKGDSLSFPESGFTIKDVLVNGVRKNFADYLNEHKVDIKNPLVADYGGAMINVSFQSIDQANKVVHLYAPVFAQTEYRLADPVGNYVKSFIENMPSSSGEIAFSCNCILNFLYSELEGKKTGSITGPITFGEVAYQLLNQTMVYLKVMKL